MDVCSCNRLSASAIYVGDDCQAVLNAPQFYYPNLTVLEGISVLAAPLNATAVGSDDVWTWGLVAGPGGVSVSPNGTVSWAAASVVARTQLYLFTVGAVNLAGTSYATFYVRVNAPITVTLDPLNVCRALRSRPASAPLLSFRAARRSQHWAVASFVSQARPVSPTRRWWCGPHCPAWSTR